MEPGVTRVPAVMAGVVTALRAHLGDVQVCYGPSTQRIEDETVVIGLGDENTLAGAETTRARTQGLGRRQTETFTLHGWLSVRSGDSSDDSVQHAVERAAELLTGIAAALEDDALRVLCDALDLGPDLTWVPAQNEHGSACGISFDITGRALL